MPRLRRRLRAFAAFLRGGEGKLSCGGVGVGVGWGWGVEFSK